MESFGSRVNAFADYASRVHVLGKVRQTAKDWINDLLPINDAAGFTCGSFVQLMVV